MSNEYAIEILEDRLKFCKEHLTEMGSVIPGLQQAINLLQSDVIASGVVEEKSWGVDIGETSITEVIDEIRKLEERNPMTNNKSIKGIIEKRLMEYAYTVTGYMGNEEIKSGCIPKAIIKKVAGNIADDLKK